MRNGQAQTEFISLGMIFAILFLTLSYKIVTFKLLSRIHVENNLYQSCSIPLEPILKPNQPAYKDDDELLITTEYFSYYIPANLFAMSRRFGYCFTEKKLLNAILQIENQINAHKITYSVSKFRNFNKSLDKYIKEQKSQEYKYTEKKLDQSLYAFRDNMNSLNSPVAYEGSNLITKITSLIKKTKTEANKR